MKSPSGVIFWLTVIALVFPHRTSLAENNNVVSHYYFVLSGGFMSCQAGSEKWMCEKVQPLVRRLREFHRIETTIIGTCFTGDTRSPSAPEDLFVEIYRKGHCRRATQKMTLDGLIRGINEKLSVPTSHRFFLAGHSHGGWLVTKVAASLAPDFRIGGLFTLDPISRDRCTPTSFRDAMLKGLRQPRLIEEGDHRRAPIDLQNEYTLVRRRVLAAGGKWNNYYQVQFSWMRSSSIPEATHNTSCHYVGGEQIKGNAHETIARDPRIWEAFLHHVRAMAFVDAPSR